MIILIFIRHDMVNIIHRSRRCVPVNTRMLFTDRYRLADKIIVGKSVIPKTESGIHRGLYFTPALVVIISNVVSFRRIVQKSNNLTGKFITRSERGSGERRVIPRTIEKANKIIEYSSIFIVIIIIND